MKTPKELIEEARKSKEGIEEDGLYSHQIGEDVSGEIIIAEIDAVINAYKLMKKSCLKVIKKWSLSCYDKGDYFIAENDIKRLEQEIKNGKLSKIEKEARL